MNNVLVLGSGAREHALAWKLEQSSKVERVFVAPGNAGTGPHLDVGGYDAQKILKFCEKENISLVVIGPEAPLADGLVNELTSFNPNLLVFGPRKEAAMLETSKIFAKNFMKEFGIVTSDFSTISSKDELETVFQKLNFKNLVVKADGLASGKGVILPKDYEDAKNVVATILDGAFGDAGNQVLIEDRLEGYEVSALAFVDGTNVVRMPLARDYKRLLENDDGPNTGGMGVIAPVQVPVETDIKIDEVFAKTLAGLQSRGINYCGVLYAGFMIVDNIPYLLEFNCRFGDPETEILMRLLDTDLYELFCCCVRQNLSTDKINWFKKHACGIVLASKNYPHEGDKGTKITEIPKDTDNVVVFHAGTALQGNDVVTNGGRVLCITAIGNTLCDARQRAIKAANEIHFDGKQFRTDIGASKPAKCYMSYGHSGVNIEEGNHFVHDLKTLVKRTLVAGTSQIGGFGAVVDLAECGFERDAQLVVGIDGVGTKIEIATICQNFSQIGYDVVAMCVNDVICHCAKPISFLDYFVCGKLDKKMATKVLTSISDACVEAGCSLIGGETAEMPGVYSSTQWDLAGCAIACREKTWPSLPDSASICENDVIIGISSSGLHSNGFSLVRNILKVNGIKYSDPTPWDKNQTFEHELLTGTKLYVRSVLPLLIDRLVKGCAHITGGGLVENSVRVLNPTGDFKFVIDCSKWIPLEIFNWLAAAGPVETKEMLRTFNCGIGMILVVGQNNLDEVKQKLTESGESFQEIGRVAKKTNNDLIEFTNESSLFNRSIYKVKREKVKVAILISGAGTNMEKLIRRAQTPGSNCEIVVVISNKADASGLKTANGFGIPTRVVPHTADRVTGDQKLAEVINSFGTELICLGGYMRILSKGFVNQFKSKIINVHPSLLPSFIGPHALPDALEFGAKVVGCTVHYVDELVDHGHIIAQKAVAVEEGDTLESVRHKVLVEEHLLFPEAMIKVAELILKKKGL